MKKIISLALSNRDDIKVDKVIYPDNIFDIPGLESIRDVGQIERYVECKIAEYEHSNVIFYVTSGLKIAVLAVINVAFRYHMNVTIMHRNSENGTYFPQKLNMYSYKKKTISNIDFELKICGQRHFGIPGEEIFNLIEPKNAINIPWLEQQAMERMKQYENKTVKIFITGLTQAIVSILNSAAFYHINVIAMHYDNETDDYFEQNVY